MTQVHFLFDLHWQKQCYRASLFQVTGINQNNLLKLILVCTGLFIALIATSQLNLHLIRGVNCIWPTLYVKYEYIFCWTECLKAVSAFSLCLSFFVLHRDVLTYSYILCRYIHNIISLLWIDSEALWTNLSCNIKSVTLVFVRLWLYNHNLQGYKHL